MGWVDALFRPRSVAVVGSVSAGKIGRVLVDQLLDGGFADVVAVNPKAEGTERVSAVRRLEGIDAGVDLAVIASPAATVAEALEDAGKAGVLAAVIVTAGFSEANNAAGELRILEVARTWGVRVVGPNCAGIVNTKHSLFPTLETRPPSGDVAFVSQSGALGGAVLSWAEEQGVGFSKFVSYGNGADLTDADFLDALREDDETSVVALYVETVSSGRRFLEAARDLVRVKPLVVIKSGRSESGSRAAMSHTGSMAGADAVFDAALKQCGAIRVDGIEEMFDLCRGFTMLPAVKGCRVAIVTNSGGPGVLAADCAESLGLEVAPPSDRLRERLVRRLQPLCGVGNPFDLTVQGTGDDYHDVLIDVLAEYDAALAINVNTPYLDAAPLARGIVTAAGETGRPIAASFLAGRPARAALPVLREGSVPNFATGERGARAIAALWQRSQIVESLGDSTPRTDTARSERESASRTTDASESRSAGGSLPEFLVREDRPLEPEAMDWLESLGFPVIAREWVKTATEAVAAARAFGRPVAMKVVSPQIVHKSDLGGVALGLETEADVRAAFGRLRGLTAEDAFRGVLVSPMVSGAVEILVGLSRDVQFGPVVACGLGGIYAELLRDVALRVAPIGREEALTMLDRLRGAAILRGARGGVSRDVGALAELVVRVSELPFRFPQIGELDLNPVFLFERGAKIGDVRLVPARDPTTP